MTLLAGHVHVRPAEREARFAVIEFTRDFPVRCAVAPLTFAPQSAAVLVLVTTDARIRKPEESLVQVRCGEVRFFCRRYVRAGVTFGALQRGVLSV